MKRCGDKDAKTGRIQSSKEAQALYLTQRGIRLHSVLDAADVYTVLTQI